MSLFGSSRAKMSHVLVLDFTAPGSIRKKMKRRRVASLIETNVEENGATRPARTRASCFFGLAPFVQNRRLLRLGGRL